MPRTIVQARIQLMLGQPWLASGIAAFPLVIADPERSHCPTMQTDGVYIFINPIWTLTLAPEEIEFVLAHEVLHCILGHIDRRGDRDPWLWNIAIDYATNALLIESGITSMPVSGGLYEPSFTWMTAENIYDRLVNRTVSDAVREMLEKAAAGLSTGDESAGGEDGESGQGDGRGFDEHLSPDDLRAAAARPGPLPSVDERRRLRRSVSVGLKGRGTMPGALSEEIRAATEARLDWRPLLSQFVTGLRRDDYRLWPMNRKHLWRGLYLPSVGVPGPEHLVVAFDTSGSMSQDELAQVLGEIDRLRAQTECRLTLIQCDAAIQSVDEFAPWEDPRLVIDGRRTYRVSGGGGTDLRPPFDWVRNKIENEGRPAPDALIYLTDGYGPFPNETVTHLPFPTVWIVTNHGAADSVFPFGAVLRMN
jgi:predicted metal-dependent peptidase